MVFSPIPNKNNKKTEGVVFWSERCPGIVAIIKYIIIKYRGSIIFRNFLSSAELENGRYDMKSCFKKNSKELDVKKIAIFNGIWVRECYYLNRIVINQKACPCLYSYI